MPKMLLSFMLFALAGAPAQADQLVPQELWHGTVPLSALTSFRVLYQFFGRDIVVLPAAEYGDEGAGAVYEPRGTDIFMHPAWRGGAGWTAVEYGLRLPERLSARLRFSVGLDQAAVGQSDGVTFRVYVGPYEKRKILWENHVAGPPTDEVEVDLSEYSGREIVLGLETHPGPDKSTAYDWAMWYGPRLLIGEKPATRPLREVDRRRLQLLYRSGLRPYVNDSGTVVPCAGPMKTQTRLRELGPNAWRFEVIGTVGDSSAMSWRVAYDCDFSDGRLSGLKLTDGDGSAWQPCRGGGIEVKVGNQNFRPESDLVKRELVEARREGDTVVAKYRYTAAGHTVEWQMAARLTGPYLEIEASAPESSQGITGFSWGRPYGFRLGRLISLPYMHWGQVWQIDRGFLTVVPDLWHSSATAVAGDGVAYRACSDGHYNALSERLWVGYVPMLEMAIHNIPHPSSPYLKDMAQRPVIDIWGGTFDAIARRLVELAEYGVDHTFIIIHNWQRAGYDVQYPDVIPANEGLGGDEALRRLCKTANSIGHRIALHENYVDFYPDAPSFTEDDVALDSDGKWVKAWLHPSTRIQSFLLKPLLAVEYARRFAPEIHRRYGTSGAYLDVHTAVAPWHKVDFDARVPGAGKFTATLQSYRELFQFMREQHSGPLTGEGGNHAFWAGLFDGAEAQVIGGEKVQPLVAYDLLKVHPLNVNHGVGYWSRWAAPDPDLPIGRSAVLPLLEDKYRAQEITFGHAGFIATELLSTPALAVREFYLMRWLQELYGTAVPTTIEYEVAGRMLPMSEALLAMAPLERIHIAYDSGLELWVNWGEEPWAVRGSLLPQWGYLAKCEPRGFSQYCALKDGVIADFMQGRDALF
ncbi:MAG: hypothetical protein H5T86_10575, partial [Armatimonadetes bacterium]|nr:hypothetical protein [Armatimonadota bacterium]